MAENNPLAKGFFFERPKPGAPTFIKGKVSIKVQDAIALLNEHVNAKGYVNLQILEKKDKSGLYMTVDTWQPAFKETEATPAQADEFPADAIPF
jgi:hypothetical protein